MIIPKKKPKSLFCLEVCLGFIFMCSLVAILIRDADPIYSTLLTLIGVSAIVARGCLTWFIQEYYKYNNHD